MLLSDYAAFLIGSFASHIFPEDTISQDVVQIISFPTGISCKNFLVSIVLKG